MTEQDETSIGPHSAPDAKAEELPSSESIAGGIYKFESILASGGAGIVYKAENVRLGKTVAIKMIKDAALSGSDVEARFLQEARATSHLSHPNIVSIYEFGTSVEGRPFLVMEWIEGISLATFIKQSAPLDLETSFGIFEQVCDAMTHAHKRGILHRDLKPSNIMLTKNADGAWQTHIIDFGIAKVTEQNDTPKLTRNGDIFGTPLYMSPEQAEGKQVDHRSDIYSLGCMMFEALTGKPPYSGETTVALLMKHQSAEIPSINDDTTKTAFPESVDSLIRSMLAKEPKERPDSFESVKKSFHEIRNPARAEKTPLSASIVRLIIKEQMLIAFLACCIVGTVWAFFMLKPDEAPVKVRLSEQHSGNRRESDEHAKNAAAKNQAAEDLNYDNSDLTDEGMKYLGSMWNLKRLSVRETLITDSGVKYLENLPLIKLDLSSTKTTDASLSTISKIKTLKELYIQESSIQGLNHGLRTLENLKSLEALDISRLGIKNEQVNDLAKLKSLKFLRCSGNPEVKLSGLTCFNTLRNLEELAMNRTHVHGGFRVLLPLKRLKYLDLAYSDTEDSDLKAIGGMRSLEALGLNDTKITDAAMRILTASRYPKLTELSLGSSELSEKAIDQFKAANPNCRVFTNRSHRRWYR